MSTDDDFAAYVGTHWSTLVRAALLLGCDADRAESVVADALVRSYQRWAPVWQDDQVDVEVLTHLLDGVYEPLGRAWHGENEVPGTAAVTADGPEQTDPGATDPGATDPDASDPNGAVSELTRALLPLDPMHRDVLVLRYVAELDELQAADVLGVRPATVKQRLERALAAVPPIPLRDEPR